MADHSSGTDSNKASLDTRALGLLERAGEFQWMLTMSAVILYVDCGLMLIKKKNLVTFDWTTFSWTEQIGTLVVAGLLFSILISSILPFLESVIASIARWMYFEWLWIHFRSRDKWERPNNMVTYGELKDYADRKESNYILAKCKEWEERWQKNQAEAHRLGVTVFRALFFLIAEIYVSSSDALSAIDMLSPYVSDAALFLSKFAAIGILFWSACLAWCRETQPYPWISFAPLYDEIKAAGAARKRQMMDESYFVPATTPTGMR